MTVNAVGDRREAWCDTCESETSQYVYHSGEWVCEGCGENV